MPSTQNLLQKSASYVSVTLNLQANRLCKSVMCCWWTHNNSTARTLSLWRHALIRNSWDKGEFPKKIKTKTTCCAPWIPACRSRSSKTVEQWRISLPATLREVEESFKADQRCPVLHRRIAAKPLINRTNTVQLLNSVLGGRGRHRW